MQVIEASGQPTVLSGIRSALAMRVERVALWLRIHVPRAYLTFSWLLGLLTIGVVPFALWSPVMLRRLLIVDAEGVKWIALFATASAFTVMATRRVVLLHGPERFGLAWPDIREEIPPSAVLGHFLIAVPLIVATCWLAVTISHVPVDVRPSGVHGVLSRGPA